MAISNAHSAPPIPPPPAVPQTTANLCRVQVQLDDYKWQSGPWSDSVSVRLDLYVCAAATTPQRAARKFANECSMSHTHACTHSRTSTTSSRLLNVMPVTSSTRASTNGRS